MRTTFILAILATAAAQPVNDLAERAGRRKATGSPIYGLCDGGITDSDDHRGASWFLYYSPENGGTNCAYLKLNNPTGAQVHMGVSIMQDRYTEPGPDEIDLGEYRRYAGPVFSTGTNGHCIGVWARVNQDDGRSWPYTACG